MGKLSLEKIDKKNIENFLKNDGRQITAKWVVWGAIINIMLLGFAIYLCENMALQILNTIFATFVVVTLLYWVCKVEHCKKNCYLFWGIYGYLFSISFSMVSYGILKREVFDNAMLILIIDSIIDVCMWCGIFVITICKIKKNKFTNKVIHIVTTGMIAPFVLCARLLERRMGTILVLGLLLNLLGVVFAAQSDFFVRYVCIRILEKNEG